MLPRSGRRRRPRRGWWDSFEQPQPAATIGDLLKRTAGPIGQTRAGSAARAASGAAGAVQAPAPPPRRHHGHGPGVPVGCARAKAHPTMHEVSLMRRPDLRHRHLKATAECVDTLGALFDSLAQCRYLWHAWIARVEDMHVRRRDRRRHGRQRRGGRLGPGPQARPHCDAWRQWRRHGPRGQRALLASPPGSPSQVRGCSRRCASVSSPTARPTRPPPCASASTRARG